MNAASLLALSFRSFKLFCLNIGQTVECVAPSMQGTNKRYRNTRFTWEIYLLYYFLSPFVPIARNMLNLAGRHDFVES